MANIHVTDETCFLIHSLALMVLHLVNLLEKAWSLAWIEVISFIDVDKGIRSQLEVEFEEFL